MFEHDTWYSRLLLEVCKRENIDPKIPIKNLSQKNKDLILHGTGDVQYEVEGNNRFGKMTYIYEEFSGVINELNKRYQQSLQKSKQLESQLDAIEKQLEEMELSNSGLLSEKNKLIGLKNNLGKLDFQPIYICFFFFRE